MLQFIIALVASLLFVAKAGSNGMVCFVETSPGNYLKQSSLEGSEFSEADVAASVAVLLGVDPPLTMSQSSALKLDELLSPDPFQRPRRVAFLMVEGLDTDYLKEKNMTRVLGVQSVVSRELTFKSSKKALKHLGGKEVRLESLNYPVSEDFDLVFLKEGLQQLDISVQLPPIQKDEEEIRSYPGCSVLNSWESLLGSMAATPFHDDEAAALKGQMLIWNLMLSYSQSIAVKTAIMLGVPDIVAAAEGRPLTVEEIASSVESKSVQTHFLEKTMSFLASRGAFEESVKPNTDEKVYSNNKVSRCLVYKNNPYSLFPMVRLHLDTDWCTTWHHLDACVLRGENPFVEALGDPLYVYTQKNAEFSTMFNAAMASLTKPAVNDMLAFYDGFNGVKSLVDVGGGVGMALSAIIGAFPNVHGINLDLPHVANNAPKIPGIDHVAGNMFESIPTADAIFMKNVLHGWSDERCLAILTNCCKALPDHGKLVLIEAVMNPSDHKTKTEQMKLMLDIVMLAHGSGRERTENHWVSILKEAGFKRVNFVRKEHCTRSIIEAFKC